MILINIHEAKAKLSEYLEAVRKGERVLICRHNRPVAELSPVEDTTAEPRDLAPMYPGATFTTAAFFDPLAQSELDAWEGRADQSELRVAEQPAPDSARAHRTRRRRNRK